MFDYDDSNSIVNKKNDSTIISNILQEKLK